MNMSSNSLSVFDRGPVIYLTANLIHAVDWRFRDADFLVHYQLKLYFTIIIILSDKNTEANKKEFQLIT